VLDKDRRSLLTRMKNAGQAASTSESGSSPLPADWDRLKGVIHTLYIVKKLRLKDVRARMEREHSFKAT
jgi:Clr5 domain